MRGAPVAQRIEQRSPKPQVEGSTPAGRTRNRFDQGSQTPKNPAVSPRPSLSTGDEFAGNIRGDVNAGVAQHFGHNLGMNSFGQKERSEGVTQTMDGENLVLSRNMVLKSNFIATSSTLWWYLYHNVVMR